MYLPVFIKVVKLDNERIKVSVCPDARGLNSNVFINGAMAQSIEINSGETIHIVAIKESEVKNDI